MTESISMIETIDSNVLRNVESFDGFGQTFESESVIFPELNSTNSNQKLKHLVPLRNQRMMVGPNREPQNRLILMGVIFAKGDPLH